MRNNQAARESRQRVAAENAAARAKRTDAQQIEWLISNGYNAKKEIARLYARIDAAGKKPPLEVEGAVTGRVSSSDPIMDVMSRPR